MDEAARLAVVLEALGVRQTQRQLDAVDRNLKDTAKSADRTQRAFRSAGTGMAAGLRTATRAAKYAGAAIGVGLAYEAKRTVQAFQESNKVSRQTRAVLKSTGNVAGTTAKRISDLASAISRKTGVDDEAIASGANLLLTFTNIRNEAGRGNKIFDQSTRVITDMSVALGQDMKSSAIQLGKALNDPVKGVTALRRVGVSFTAEQQKQIDTLVKSNRTLDAQKLILGELRKEFGGSARAQATSTAKLSVAFGNLEEDIGSGLAPAVDAIANKLTHLAQDVEPQVIRASRRIGKLFGRKDLSLEQKFRLSRAELRENFRPLTDEARRAFGNMRVGDKLSTAVENAAPRIADAMAAAAPRAAGAFANAFKEAGPWGKLITVAFLAQKLGAFSAVGSMAADRFWRRYRRKSVGMATAAGTAAGAANAAAFSTAASAGMISGKGKFRGAALAIGRFMGPLMAIPIAVELSDALTKQFGHEGGTQGQINKTAAKVRSIIEKRSDLGITAPRSGIPRDPDFRPRAAADNRAPGYRRRRRRRRGHRTERPTYVPLPDLGGDDGGARERQRSEAAERRRAQDRRRETAARERANRERRAAIDRRQRMVRAAQDKARRSSGDGGRFRLNVGDVRVPTVYEVRRSRALAGAGGSPRAVSQAPQATVVHGGVHITIDGAGKHAREIAEETVALINQRERTMGAAARRARKGRKRAG